MAVKIVSTTVTTDSIRVVLSNKAEFSFGIYYDGHLKIDASFCDVVDAKKTAANLAEIIYSNTRDTEQIAPPIGPVPEQYRKK